MIYPWLVGELANLAALGERIPHAVLLRGQSGIGKFALGERLARRLLCESPGTEREAPGGCGTCPACLWFDQGSHPDFRLVTSEALAAAAGAELADDGGDAQDAEVPAARSKKAPSKEIKVDQIRSLHAFLAVGTHRGRFRVVLLDPLEAVNDVAANALLKMLEEPPERTVFILVADQLGRLPATIVSRCHKVFVATPAVGVATAWLADRQVADPEALLALSGGAPLDALALSQDAEALASHRALLGFLGKPGVDAALAVGESFARTPPAPLIRWIQLWVADCVAMRLAGRVRYHPTRVAVVAELAGRGRLDALMELMQRLSAVRGTIDHPLNPRLMLESVLLAYADTMAPSSA